MIEYVWRCDHCGSASVLTEAGGDLNCVCAEPHTDFHFQALTPNPYFELEVWYDPKQIDVPFT